MDTYREAIVAGLLILVMIFIGCDSPERRYKRLEKKELARNERFDDLFFGIRFGMSNQEFRDHCYEMNLQGKFKQGGQRNLIWVECKLPEEMDYPAAINFYPEFTNDTITGMNASVYYDNAVFRDGIFETDSLLLDVLALSDKWYGAGHTRIESPVFYKEDIYVKIRGNRRITIYPDISGQMINLWYQDLKSRKPNEDE
ncbi:hypothetical protein [Flavilitoribacter nigricans]|nr:hypothetical protein [Flavilitoribacter nigricans]